MAASSSTKENIRNRYEFGKVLGKGQFGTVRLARCIQTRRFVAIKVIAKSNFRKSDTATSVTDKFRKESDMLRICEHPHIVQYIECCEDDGSHYIVMEYLQHGDLFDHVTKLYEETGRGLSEIDAKKVFAQIISALELCHGKLIAHRDLKVENVMVADIDNLIIKLCDFGFANYINSTGNHNTLCGSPEYASPEILMGQTYKPMKSDIWSLGVVLYVMVTGSFPWKTDMSGDMITSITSHKYIVPPYITAELNDLFSKIFQQMDDRITLQKLKQHPWIKDHLIPSYAPSKGPVTNINCFIVHQIVALGYPDKEVMSDVLYGRNTTGAAIYHTLLDRMGKDLDNLHATVSGSPSLELDSVTKRPLSADRYGIKSKDKSKFSPRLAVPKRLKGDKREPKSSSNQSPYDQSSVKPPPSKPSLPHALRISLGRLASLVDSKGVRDESPKGPSFRQGTPPGSPTSQTVSFRHPESPSTTPRSPTGQNVSFHPIASSSSSRYRNSDSPRMRATTSPRLEEISSPLAQSSTSPRLVEISSPLAQSSTPVATPSSPSMDQGLTSVDSDSDDGRFGSVPSSGRDQLPISPLSQATRGKSKGEIQLCGLQRMGDLNKKPSVKDIVWTI
jgi:serine/threonine protein kinase